MSSTFDRDARAGIRTTAYQEWQLMALIHIVQLDLKGHPLTQKDSDFTKIMRELAKSLHSQLEAQAPLRVVCTRTMRKLALAEIGWDVALTSKALGLLLNKKCENLFGSKTEGDNIMDFNSIAPDYHEKLQTINDFRPALYNPKILNIQKPLKVPNDKAKGDYKGEFQPSSSRGCGNNSRPRNRQRDRRYSYSTPAQHQLQGKNFDDHKKVHDKGQGQKNYPSFPGKGRGRQKWTGEIYFEQVKFEITSPPDNTLCFPS